MILAAAYYGTRRISRAWLDGNLIDFRERTYLTAVQEASLSGIVNALARKDRQSGADTAAQLMTAAAADADQTVPARVDGVLMIAAIAEARPDDAAGGVADGRLGRDTVAAASPDAPGRYLRLVFGLDIVCGVSPPTAAGGDGLSPESADNVLKDRIVGRALKSPSSSGAERNIENASAGGRTPFATDSEGSSGVLFDRFPGQRSTLVRRNGTDSLGAGRGEGNSTNTEPGSSVARSIASDVIGGSENAVPAQTSVGLACEEAAARQAEPVSREVSTRSLSASARPTEVPPSTGATRGSSGNSAASASRKSPVQSGEAAATIGGIAAGEAQNVWAVLRDGILYIYQTYDAQLSGAYLTIE